MNVIEIYTENKDNTFIHLSICPEKAVKIAYDILYQKKIVEEDTEYGRDDLMDDYFTEDKIFWFSSNVKGYSTKLIIKYNGEEIVNTNKADIYDAVDTILYGITEKEIIKERFNKCALFFN